MRLPSVDPFVGAAKRAHMVFHILHQPEGSTGLLVAGSPANGTVMANIRQDTV